MSDAAVVCSNPSATVTGRAAAEVVPALLQETGARGM